MNETLVVVDNNTESCQKIINILKSNGYRCQRVDSVSSCADWIKSSLEKGTHADIVLFDSAILRYGNEKNLTKNKNELNLKRLKEIRFQYGVPIVLLVSPDNDEDFGASIKQEVPIHGFIPKLIQNPTYIRQAVAHMLRQCKEERELKQREEKYRFFFNYIPIAAIVSDENYIIHEWNHTAEDVFGYSREEVLQKEIVKVLYSEENTHTAKQLKQSLLQTLKLRKRSRNVNYDRTKDGRHVLCEWFDLPFDMNGKKYIFSAAKDITKEQELLDTLTETVARKNFLMQEIHHRLKNNLNMIVSLINLKMIELEESTSNADIDNSVSSSDHIKNSDDSYGALLDVHNKISALSVLYDMLNRQGEGTVVNLKQYMHELLPAIFNSMADNKCVIKNEMQTIWVEPQKAIVLGLITNEIATNAIKHGFIHGEEQIFTVSLNKLTGTEKKAKSCCYEYTLTNSGRPFPAHIDLSHTTSLGLQLINSFIDQLGGCVKLKKKPSPIFKIYFS